MRNSYICDHLTVAKLGAIAENDPMLAYLIDMAILYESQRTKQLKPVPSDTKAA